MKRETLLAENKSYAEFNLAKEPKLTQAKHQLAAAYDAAVTLQKQAEQNKQKLGMSATECRSFSRQLFRSAVIRFFSDCKCNNV